LSKELVEANKNTERIYKEMGKACALIHQTTVEFNQENHISENEVLEKVFFGLQNVFLCQGLRWYNSRRNSQEGSWNRSGLSPGVLLGLGEGVDHARRGTHQE
jgi:hypothetical protein